MRNIQKTVGFSPKTQAELLDLIKVWGDGFRLSVRKEDGQLVFSRESREVWEKGLAVNRKALERQLGRVVSGNPLTPSRLDSLVHRTRAWNATIGMGEWEIRTRKSGETYIYVSRQGMADAWKTTTGDGLRAVEAAVQLVDFDQRVLAWRLEAEESAFTVSWRPYPVEG
jgi:hypothetical protein